MLSFKTLAIPLGGKLSDFKPLLIYPHDTSQDCPSHQLLPVCAVEASWVCIRHFPLGLAHSVGLSAVFGTYWFKRRDAVLCHMFACVLVRRTCKEITVQSLHCESLQTLKDFLPQKQCLSGGQRPELAHNP